MFAVCVTLEIAAGAEDAFMAAMRENAATSLREEAGCHRFDVAVSPENPRDVFLYELYENAAAFFEVHLKAPHFLAFDATVSPMLVSKVVKTYELQS